MASTRGHKTPHLKMSLIEKVNKEASKFGFHALIKIIERLNPQSTPLGEGHHPDEEAIKIQTKIGFDFPPSDIVDLKTDEQGKFDITTAFFNIAGIQGPLPTPYVQHIIERDRQKDTAQHTFLDIFNHRLISLLHRIRKKYWVGVAADPPETTYLGRTLKSLLGLSTLEIKDQRLKTLDRSLLYYTGLLWQRPRSRVGLEKVLSHFFNTTVRVEEFQGGWVSVPEKQQSMIGKYGRFQTLGHDAILGDRFWDQQNGIKVHVGPVGIKAYVNFLKPGKAYRELKTLIAYYCGEDQEFHLNLILKKEEIPTVQLGKGMALHWTSWLSRHQKTNVDDQQNTMDRKPFKII